MAATNEVKQDSPLANPEGKTVAELVDIAQVLQVQVNDSHLKATQYQKLAENEVTKNTKARGALEVMLQLIPQKEKEELVDKEETHEEEEVEK